ncbi:MAG: DEAD/DEAH box helicase [Pseudomonadales bacterium]|nr:DEAD/DEAH box helicase [Pseudomonadales bacterium]
MTSTPAAPDPASELTFADLELAPPILAAVTEVGYEVPTPIQARTIPPLLEGRDLLGQAQTGTGKTAAFALPLLSRVDVARRTPQVLVLAPTRELAIQVAEAFQRYAAKLPGLHVLPIYGGQEYGVQLRMLARGVHVVVGTPGRVMDHMRRGTLDLTALSALVLDEADEMLRMGFIDDVEWILGQTPPERQLALFSATLPAEVQRIARRYLNQPVEVRLESRATAAASVRQRVWLVAGTHKLDALTRILEVEPFEAMIVFVRTRNTTVELAERLCARGFDADAIHGDIPQRQREKIIGKLRSGDLDILVATDVAARGLDVERISHVVNFDIPYDTEAYIHRIGRTGRAGRSGDAILFAAPRERNMLRSIERATGRVIELMELPSHEAINNVRVQRFFDALTRTLAEEDLTDLVSLMERYQREHGVDPLLLAAALVHHTRGGSPLLVRPRRTGTTATDHGTEPKPAPHAAESAPHRKDRAARKPAERAVAAPADTTRSRTPGDVPRKRTPQQDFEPFRIEVGRSHGVEPRNILGAIANEAGLDARNVGRIELHDDYSIVELPPGMPKPVFDHLRRVWVSGRQLKLSRVGGPPPTEKPRRQGASAKPTVPGKRDKPNRTAKPRKPKD